MSDSNPKNLNGLSAVERLKATDKYLTEMRGILASMDEIAALRRQRGEALPTNSADTNVPMWRALSVSWKSRRNPFWQRSPVRRQRPPRRKAFPRRRAQSAGSRGGIFSRLFLKRHSRHQFPQGDPSLAIESMYTGLSMDIEKMRERHPAGNEIYLQTGHGHL